MSEAYVPEWLQETFEHAESQTLQREPIWSPSELRDILNCADERGVPWRELVRNAVENELVR